MPVIAYQENKPQIGPECFIAPDAWVIGKAEIGDHVSIFFGAVIRGDIQAIKIGSGSNLQEHVMLHTSHGLQDCIVGEDVTVGHRAIIHGCTVRSSCIIGMGSVILDG
ncbi:MAG: gamma carbonic anhydrase family protein, partial [Proteobacteria bacterium]